MNKVYLNDHMYALLANELRSVAKEFADQGQLRTRLVGALEQYGVLPEHKRDTSDDVRTAFETWYAAEMTEGTVALPLRRRANGSYYSSETRVAWSAYQKAASLKLIAKEPAKEDDKLSRLSALVLELAEAVNAAAFDVGGSRPQLDILRDAVRLAEGTEPQQHDSTGAMAAAWFGTPGAAGAVSRVFGGEEKNPGWCIGCSPNNCMGCATPAVEAKPASPWQTLDSVPRNRLILLGVEYGRESTPINRRQRTTFVAQSSVNGVTGEQSWYITTDCVGWTRMHPSWNPRAWRDLPSWYHANGDGPTQFREWLNERRDYVVSVVFGDIVEKYEADIVRSVRNAEDALLTEIPCECSYRRREEGDHASGCHLYEATVARPRK